MREMILLLGFMVQIRCPIYFSASIKHKIRHLYLTLCFVTEIIKALRGRGIGTHSCSNSHASKGFGFNVPSSKIRSNDLWSRDPTYQSAICSIHGTPVLTMCNVLYCKYAVLKHMIHVGSQVIRLCADDENWLSPPVWKTPFGYTVSLCKRDYRPTWHVRTHDHTVKVETYYAV